MTRDIGNKRLFQPYQSGLLHRLNHLNHHAVPRDTELFPNKPRYSGHLNFSLFLHLHQGLQFYLDIQCSTLQTSFTQLKKTKRERICICNVGFIWLNLLLTPFISHPDLQLSLVTASGALWHIFFHFCFEGTKSQFGGLVKDSFVACFLWFVSLLELTSSVVLPSLFFHNGHI